MEVPFKCEACGTEGTVANPKNMERLSCECGALYLYYPNGMLHGEKQAWKCVVKPIFADE